MIRIPIVRSHPRSVDGPASYAFIDSIYLLQKWVECDFNFCFTHHHPLAMAAVFRYRYHTAERGSSVCHWGAGVCLSPPPRDRIWSDFRPTHAWDIFVSRNSWDLYRKVYRLDHIWELVRTSTLRDERDASSRPSHECGFKLFDYTFLARPA